MNHMKLSIEKLETAQSAVIMALPSVDAYIEELQDQLAYAQALRKAMAAAGDVNRRDMSGEASPVQSMIDRADRAHLEGEVDGFAVVRSSGSDEKVGRLVPRQVKA